MTITGPQEIVERALARSRADGCVVLVEEETSVNLRWANSALTTNGTATTRRVTVICIVGGIAGTGVGAVSHSGAFDDEAIAADTIEAYEARVAALERLVGKRALEIEFLKGAVRHAPRPRSATTSVIAGPAASPSQKDAG